MNYQGEQVNFSQNGFAQTYSDSALNSIIQNLQMAVYKYPQQVGTASSRSDSDIWKWLAENITGESSEQTGGNDHYSWAANPNAAFPKIIKQNKSQDDSINANKMEIQVMNERLSRQVVELGNALKGHSDSPHNQGGGGNPFGFLTGLSTTALAAGGIGAYLLLKGKRK